MGDSMFKGEMTGDIKRFRQELKERYSKGYDLNDFLSEIELFGKIVLSPPDVVQYLDGEHSFGVMPDLLKTAAFKRPKIMAMYHQPPSVLRDLVNPAAADNADMVQLMAENQVEFFKKHIGSSRIRVMKHGVDTDFFRPGAKIQAGRIRCLTVGKWLRDYKAVSETAEILKDEKDIEFIIVNPAYKKTRENETVLSGLSDEELLKLYQSCDILFLPLTDATANNVLLEGMACGCAAVSSDIPGVVEYAGRDNAVLVQNNSPQKFAEIISSLASDKKLMEAYSEKSVNHAKGYCWQNVTDSYLRAYQDIAR